jgi:5-formyltetrahydrofolate cyclo-ligase
VPGIAADKAALRRVVLTARARLPDAQRRADAAAAVAQALELPELSGARVVAAYVATGDELPTEGLLDALLHRGLQVIVPVLGPLGGLEWAPYDGPAGLVDGRRGTRHPRTDVRLPLSSADVVVVPGVAFDVEGRRVGRGGGSYDRALAGLSPRPPVLALARDEEVVSHVPVEPHDVCVSIVVTPTRVLRA